MLHILYLEDSRIDAVLMEKALTSAGVRAEWTVVADRPQFLAAIEKPSFDLVLADGGLPGITSIEAIGITRKKYPQLPFVCVSGAVREDQAAELLKAGASDYILKDHPWHIVTAIRQTEERLRLQQSNRGMSRLVKAVQELSLARDLNGIIAVVRTAARELTGADGASFVLNDKGFCYYADEDAISPLWKGQRFPLEKCISGWVMLNRTPAVIEDIYKDPRIPADAYRPTFVKSLAMVPIRIDAPIAAIGNYWATQYLPTPEQVELLQALANTTAVAMENVKVYAELEQRVKDRTIQLEIANKELDSFSHAVSHDLGAPLRAVRGFANLLVSECDSQLNDTGKKYAQNIIQGSEGMRELIDDLLRLSRITRTELKHGHVNLSEIACEIVGRFKSASPERTVDVRIADGLTVNGDLGLLRILLENLLSNAWKYSSKSKDARIEFGVAQQPDGSIAYFIRDNGAGFDMADASRLFEPFQRLHTQEEFVGSGIGLTTVQRIVQRHGGRIWVEAKKDQGACFFFTLGNTAT